MNFWGGNLANEMNESRTYRSEEEDDKNIFEVAGGEVLVNNEGDLDEGCCGAGEKEGEVETRALEDDQYDGQDQERDEDEEFPCGEPEVVGFLLSLILALGRGFLTAECIFGACYVGGDPVLFCEEDREFAVEPLVFALRVDERGEAVVQALAVGSGQDLCFLCTCLVELCELIYCFLQIFGVVLYERHLGLFAGNLCAKYRLLFLKGFALCHELVIDVRFFNVAVERAGN